MIRFLVALLLAFAPLAPTLAQAEPQRFSVVVEGEGRDVILIPGLSSPRAVWDGARAHLGGKYRLHLVQLRGFGEPAGINAEGPVLEPFVDELASYIRTHNLEKPLLVGHSMGGLAALMIGTRHPDLPGRIMVVDALPFIGTLFDPAATVATITPRAAAMRDMIKAQHAANPPVFDAPAVEAGEEIPVQGNLSNSQAGLRMVAHGTRVSDLRVVAQAMYDDFVTDLRPDLPRLKAPVTLLYPQDDRLVTAERADALYTAAYQGTPDLTAIRIAGSYHFIMADQPERFHAALDTFLED